MSGTIDVVVPAFNGASITRRCVDALQTFGVPGQRVVLVDDGSPDAAEREALADLGARVCFDGGAFVTHPSNRGPHAAWNTGWRTGNARYVCFINNDVVVCPWTLKRLLADLQLASDLYVSAREIQGPAPPAKWPIEETDWSPDADGTPSALLVWRSRIGDAADLRTPPAKLKGPDHFHACFAVRRSLLEELDGFDERMFLAYSDTDFLERAKDKGITPMRDMNAPVWHGVSVTRRKEFGVEGDLEREARDRLVFEAKWADRPDVLRRHPGFTGDAGREAREFFWAKGKVEDVEER